MEQKKNPLVDELTPESDRKTPKPGLDFLESLDPHGPASLHELRMKSADLVDALVDRLYGDVYQRDKLNLRERLLVTVAIAMVSEHMRRQLPYHCQMAIRNGVTGEELMEITQQVSVFCGFPAAITGMQVIDEVAERVAAEKAENG